MSCSWTEWRCWRDRWARPGDSALGWHIPATSDRRGKDLRAPAWSEELRHPLRRHHALALEPLRRLGHHALAAAPQQQLAQPPPAGGHVVLRAGRREAVDRRLELGARRF